MVEEAVPALLKGLLLVSDSCTACKSNNLREGSLAPRAQNEGFVCAPRRTFIPLYILGELVRSCC